MIFNTLKFIYTHPFNRRNKPGSLLRFVKWQINCLLNPYPILYPYTENTKLVIWKGLTGATGNLYCGLAEFNDMGFLLHFLRDSDLFIDVGANIGAYTILASGEIGARTIAIEPIPATFGNLRQNIAVNQIQDKVEALNIGLGAKKEIVKFTSALDTLNHVTAESGADTVEVQIETLDSIVSKKLPALIKIDVEGFETEVLNGATEVLQASTLKAIIIELNGSGKRYGYDENNIHEKLIGHKFLPYNYNPIDRSFMKMETYGSHNTIYIRDMDFVKARVETSRSIKVGRGRQL